MKQIIPFHKEIVFRTMIGEITSISLENTLKFTSSDTIEGDFIVSGTYKMTEASQIEEDFSYKIPATITLNDCYDTFSSTVDIDNFTYEIINEEILKVHIDVLIDGIEEAVEELVRSDDSEVVEPIFDLQEEQVIATLPIEELAKVEEVSLPVMEEESPKEQIRPSIDSIFSAFKDTEETFSTYYVYIVRESDTLDSIIEKYNTTREELGNYNNLEEIKVGTKLIIPTTITK